MGRACTSVLLGSVILAGCAPSIRMVHQNAEYFERCQAADYDPAQSREVRRGCWARWLEHYSQGQPQDRVRHAEARLAALDSGGEDEPLPGIERVGSTHTASFLSTSEQPGGSAAQPETDRSSEAGTDRPDEETAPSERSTADDGAEPDEPDEPDEDGAEPDEDEARPLPAPPEGHSSACAPMCKPRWERCVRACTDDSDACMDTCEGEYRVCLKGCH